MNYLQLVQRLKRESGRSGSPPASIAVLAGDDINLGNWVADAWLEVQRKRMDWAWMRKSIVDAPLLLDQLAHAVVDLDELVTDLARWAGETGDYTVRVKNTTAGGLPYGLAWLPYERFQAIYINSGAQSGAPQHWSVAPDKALLIGPAPNSADYTVTADYWAKPTALLLDDDEPGMPEEFHLLLVWRALLEVAGFDAAPEVELRARRNLRMAWSDLIDDQAPRPQLGEQPLA